MANTIYRGTNPEILINIKSPISLADAKEIWLTLKSGNNYIKKTKSDLEIDNNSGQIYAKLTQAETLDLHGRADLQIRILTSSGMALSSDIKSITVKNILTYGEITAKGGEENG